MNHSAAQYHPDKCGGVQNQCCVCLIELHTKPCGKTRITLAEAQAILAAEPTGTERWALANTIVSLHQAIKVNESLIEDYERTTARLTKAAGL